MFRLSGPSLRSLTRADVETSKTRSGEDNLKVELQQRIQTSSAVGYFEKISEYIASGVKLVWLVDPEAQTVMVYNGTTRGIEYGDADSLDGGEVLPGFTCTVAELFT